jgi:hypothetical protein
VIDDYYTQCEVFQDCDGNRVKDADELTCTILDGRCNFESYAFNLTLCDTYMVANQSADCVDAGTDAKPFIDLIGSGTTVSILTTMHTELMAVQNLDEDAAFQKLVDAFPKLVGVDIHGDDPVAGQLEATGSTLQRHVNHIGVLSMVNGVMSQIISMLSSTLGSRRLSGRTARKLAGIDAMAAATKSFTTSIASASADQPLDLTNSTAIVEVISVAFEEAAVDSALVPDVSTVLAIADSTAAINTMTEEAVESVDTSSSGRTVDLMSSINTFNYMQQVSLEEESKKLVTGEIDVDSFTAKTDAAVLKESAALEVATIKAKRPTRAPTAMPTLAPTAIPTTTEAPTPAPTPAPTASPTRAYYGMVEFDLEIQMQSNFTSDSEAKYATAIAATLGASPEQVKLTVKTAAARRLQGLTILQVVVKAWSQDDYTNLHAALTDRIAFVNSLVEELAKVGVTVSASNLVVRNVVATVSDPEEDSTLPLWIIGVVVALVVVGLFVKKRLDKKKVDNKKKIYNDTSSADDGPMDTPAEPAAAQSPTAEPIAAQQASTEPASAEEAAAEPAVPQPVAVQPGVAELAEEEHDDFANNILGPPGALMDLGDGEFADESDSEYDDDSDEDDDLAAANILGPPAWIAESWKVESESETDGGLTSGGEVQ